VDEQIDEEPTSLPKHVSQHLAATLIIEILPPTSDKKTPAPTSALPKKRARIARSTITSRPLTPSVVAPTIKQNPPIVVAADQAPTIITCASSQKRKHLFKGKPRRALDQIGSTKNQSLWLLRQIIIQRYEYQVLLYAQNFRKLSSPFKMNVPNS
jgi:hypothetical protein